MIQTIRVCTVECHYKIAPLAEHETVIRTGCCCSVARAIASQHAPLLEVARVGRSLMPLCAPDPVLQTTRVPVSAIVIKAIMHHDTNDS